MVASLPPRGHFECPAGCFEYEFFDDRLLMLRVLSDESRLTLHGVDYAAWARYRNDGQTWTVVVCPDGSKERYLHTRRGSVRPWDEKLEDEACELMLRSFMEWTATDLVAAAGMQRALALYRVERARFHLERAREEADRPRLEVTRRESELMAYESELHVLTARADS